MAKKKRDNIKKHNMNSEGHDDSFLSNLKVENDMTSENTNISKESLNPIDNESLQNQMIEDSQVSNSSPSQIARQDTETKFIDSIGHYLKEQREARGVTLKNVSQSTKINITNLELLEKNRMDLLPDKAYVTGYVKNYVKILSLDLQECLELLDSTYQKVEPRKVPVVVTSDTSVETEGLTGYRYLLISATVIILIAGLGFFLFRSDGSNSSVNDQENKVVEKEEIITEEENVTPVTLTETTPLNEGIKEGAKQEVKKQVIQASKEKPLDLVKAKTVVKEEVTPKATEDKKEESKKTFSPVPENLYTIDKQMSLEEKNAIIPTNFRNSLVPGKQNIIIVAVNDDSWLTYKADDKPIKKFVLKKDRTLLIRGDEVRMFIGRLGAVKIFLNNKPLKMFSSSGVKSIVFPKENKNKYLLPLFLYNKDGTVQTSDVYIKENQ